MLQNNRSKVLQSFFDYPLKNFQMREISRNVKISQPSVLNYLKSLLKEGLILKENKGIYPSYRANRDSEIFKNYKKINLLFLIYQSNLIEYINNECFPRVIILFGSASIGEDTDKSDIDLYVDSKTKDLNLKKYENLFKRKINLLYEEDFKKISPELKNNLINGIILKGYLKAF